MYSHLADFAENISPYIGEPWIAWPYLRKVCSIIEEELKKPDPRIIINWPPRHGKSFCLSYWLPVWLLELVPEARILLSSYEHSIASRWGRKVRDAFSHEILSTKVKQDMSSVDNWETTSGGGMLCTGIGGRLTGLGGNILVDDPCKNAEQANSITYRENTKDWYASTLRTRLEPGGFIIINQTRWHEDDLSGWLLSESSENWKHICIPAIAEQGDILGRKEGEALCPDRYPVSDLLKIKEAVGSRVWAGLYQQRPMPTEGAIIKTDWLKFYDEFPSNVIPAGISVDATFDKTEAGSYVVLQVWGISRPNYYLLDQIRKRMEFTETVDALKTLIQKWPQARAKWIEKKANGAAIISTLKKEIDGLIPVNPTGGKEARLQAVSPLFEAGNVFLPKREPWIGDYIQELTLFPNAKNDDQVDATSQALFKMKSSLILGGTLPL